jgi:hypothetical protein
MTTEYGYGTIEGVAALARTWTENNTFADETIYAVGTNPELHSVISWLNEVSAMLDVALGKYGFVVPLSSTAGRLSAKSIVEQITADIVKYVNNQGRFFSERFVDSGMSVWKAIRTDLDLWVLEFAPGLANAGETQHSSDIDAIGFSDHDESGEKMFPIFQRKGFGNTFDDWTQ